MSEQRTGLPGVPSPTERTDVAAPLAPTTPTTAPGTYAGGTTATQVLDRTEDAASDVLGHVTDGAAEVKDVVAAQVHSVAGEAKQEAKHLVEEAKQRVAAEADSSTKQFAQVLVDAGHQLVSMAERAGEEGPATDIVREIGDRAQQLGTRIQRDGYRGVTEDLSRWARRNPGVFLVAAGATGFVVGRLFRNVNTSKLTDAAKNGANGSNGSDGSALPSGPTANQLFDPAHANAQVPSLVDLTEPEAGFGGNVPSQGAVPGMRP